MLREVGYLDKLDPDTFRRVYQAGKIAVYDEGTVLMKQGKVATGFYILLRGTVALRRSRPTDDASKLEIDEYVRALVVALISDGVRLSAEECSGWFLLFEVHNATCTSMSFRCVVTFHGVRICVEFCVRLGVPQHRGE